MKKAKKVSKKVISKSKEEMFETIKFITSLENVDPQTRIKLNTIRIAYGLAIVPLY